MFNEGRVRERGHVRVLYLTGELDSHVTVCHSFILEEITEILARERSGGRRRGFDNGQKGSKEAAHMAIAGIQLN